MGKLHELVFLQNSFSVSHCEWPTTESNTKPYRCVTVYTLKESLPEHDSHGWTPLWLIVQPAFLVFRSQIVQVGGLIAQVSLDKTMKSLVEASSVCSCPNKNISFQELLITIHVSVPTSVWQLCVLCFSFSTLTLFFSRYSAVICIPCFSLCSPVSPEPEWVIQLARSFVASLSLTTVCSCLALLLANLANLAFVWLVLVFCLQYKMHYYYKIIIILFSFWNLDLFFGVLKATLKKIFLLGRFFLKCHSL